MNSFLFLTTYLNVGDGPLQYLVMVTGCVSVGKIGESEVFRINQTSFFPLRGPQTVEEEKVTELRKLFNSGTFYFLWSSSEDSIDATLCTQKLQHNPSVRTRQGTDNRFFWNRFAYNKRFFKYINISLNMDFNFTGFCTYHCNIME